MWSMISWRVTAIGGWARRRLVGFQLKKNVIDLSDDDKRYTERGEVALHVD